MKGTGPTCNTAVDSDGNDVHMFDDDGNAATRKSCGGVNFATDVEFTTIPCAHFDVPLRI